MADDDFDRPHYHDGLANHCCEFEHDNPCTADDCRYDDDVLYILPADIYKQLVVAARDRHPTNHQRYRVDPAGRAYDSACPICDRTRRRST